MKIPEVHTDESLGLDEYTIFIERYSNEQSHFIKMWEPDKKYSINKIAKAFRDFSKTIADNPLEEYAW